MMLDQDSNASNGIQISEAVTAAAAGWAPVDFDSADLPATLGSLIQQASTADGVLHAFPDAATAQTRLRAEFFCTYSGRYDGSHAGSSIPGDRGPFTVEVFPDGSVHAGASSTATLAGFDVVTVSALNPLLDASFALSSESPSIVVQGSFSDPTYLSGTYLGDAAGTFEAIGDSGTAPTYKFVGTYTSTPVDPTLTESSGLAVLGMDDTNQVSGDIDGFLQGTVSGTTFAGTITKRGGSRPSFLYDIQVSGTLANTGLGYTLEVQYFDTLAAFNGGGNIKITTVGCRAN
jgi:hypothetical protein